MSHKRPLSADNALRLLDLLCTDDAFRAEFAADPTTTLVRHALQPMAAGGACAIHGVLASKEEFALVRTQLQASLARSGPFTVPFMFESGQLQSVLVPTAVGYAA